MELVSIVIPVYNCETKLKRCLQSVQKQTYKDIEVLIVNDGSTDNSLQVCEEFCKQDVRFHVFNQKNHGVSYSRNQGIKKANGQYLMFVDGDDEVLPDMVQQYSECQKWQGRCCHWRLTDDETKWGYRL